MTWQALFRALGGIPPVDKKLSQFLLNDRKVLRFKAGYSGTKISSNPLWLEAIRGQWAYIHCRMNALAVGYDTDIGPTRISAAIAELPGLLG